MMPSMASPAHQTESLKIELLVDSIPALIHTARPDGYLDYFNKPWLEYLGTTLDKVAGWNWTAFVHPEDLDGIVAKWRACLATGETFEYETRVRRANGEYRWMFHHKVPLRDAGGNIVKWYGSSLDIEDRKTAEEQLRRNAQELQRSQFYLAEGQRLAHMGSWAFDPDGFYYWSLELFRMHGLDPASKPPSVQEYLDCVHPQDRESMADLIKGILSKPSPFDATKRIVRPDGEVRYIRCVGVPLAANETTKKYIGSALDVTEHELLTQELRRREAYMAEAQRLSHIGSFGWNPETGEIAWSDETYRIFEYDRAVEPTLDLVLERVHPEERAVFQRVIARASERATQFEHTYRLLLPDGRVKHVRGIARVLEQSEGRPLFIGALQDVTESKLAEEALNRARSELAHVARVTMLNTLTASIAHELNQPLSGIITNASTCLRMLDGDPPNVTGAHETARRTIRDGNRASDVITRLRGLFSKKDCSLESLDLNEATQEVIALSLSDLQRNRVILRSELAEDLPPVIGDRVQLQQVILNLLRNASDAMITVEDRPRELLIRTEKGEGDRVRLSVKDAGVGFRPEAADKLFEAFYTTKKDGMGIGLSVSRFIIEAHRGSLWAVPNDGPGATFSFSVPGRSKTLADSQTAVNPVDSAPDAG
jgi:PAS domain S-box-containing protein